MDLRILNTCNSNCLYCLEQSLRKKKKFMDRADIFQQLEQEKSREVLSFYGWNPLLHPELCHIITDAKDLWFQNIALLSNTLWLSPEYLKGLQEAGLTTLNFYFHSFDEAVHDRVVNGGISLKMLLKNMTLITSSGLSYKAIIHVNAQNITTLSRDVLVLHKRFWVESFEFVNYFPASRAYKLYDDILAYDANPEKLKDLDYVIEKYNLRASFKKFQRNYE